MKRDEEEGLTIDTTSNLADLSPLFHFPSSSTTSPPRSWQDSAAAASKSMPFLAVGKQVGDALHDAAQAAHEKVIHVTFGYDKNKYALVWNRFFYFVFHVAVLPLAAAAAYRIANIGLAFQPTTKNFVVILELPAAMLLLYKVITGPAFFASETSGFELM